MAREVLLKSFLGEVVSRMKVGSEEYGEGSYERPLGELLSEIQEELVDVAGWSSIMWARCEKIREQLKKMEE